MFTITNGTVEYERVTKPGDYEKRAAKVVLSYNVDEGTDPQAAMRAVFEMAVAEVHGQVGLVAAAPAELLSRYEAPVVQQARPTPTATTAGAGTVEAAATPGPTASPTATPPNPFAIGGKAAKPAVNPTPITAAPTATVEPASEPSPAAADPVMDNLTDSDLHAVAQTAIEKKIDPNKVRAITAKYAGAMGMTISMIPAEKRQAWLDDVKGLYKS